MAGEKDVDAGSKPAESTTWRSDSKTVARPESPWTTGKLVSFRVRPTVDPGATFIADELKDSDGVPETANANSCS